jgi:hypothetical protein
MADWDRQPDEPSLWFDRFERYRRMGPGRSVLGCLHAEEAQKGKEKQSPCPPSSWSAAVEQWRWKERARAWDDEQTRLAREAEALELAERRKVWIEQAKAIQTKAWKRLQAMESSELSVKETLEYFREGVKQELLARGQPTEISKVDASLTPSEQLADLDRAFAGAADREEAGAVRGDRPPQPVDAGEGPGGADDEAG